MDQGYSWPLHGTGLGLTFTWSRVRSILTWRGARAGPYMELVLDQVRKLVS
jgi:hypothetical protein